MKKNLILFTVMMAACNQPSKTKPVPNDTLKTLAVFQLRDGKRKLDYIFQIAKDTVSVDSSLRARRVRDTIYYIPDFTPALDSSGKQMKDSTGQPVFRVQYNLAPDTVIKWSANKDIDTLLKTK